MKLTKASVEKFKSIEDSGPFTLDQVTCLVGKNEAGKTAVLEALYKLNPVEENTGDFGLEEYPRKHLTTYRQRMNEEPATVVRTQWELEDDDVKRLEEQYCAGVLTCRTIRINKGYSNKLLCEIPLDEGRIVRSILASANLNAAERGSLAKQESVRDLLAKLSEIESPTPKQQALLQGIQNKFAGGDANSSVTNTIIELLPKFVYFDIYSQLPGRVALDDLKRQIAQHGERSVPFKYRIFLALLGMTGTSLADIEGASELETLIMELEAVGAHLTDKIKEYWTQNQHLRVVFRYDAAKADDAPPLNSGFILSTRIENTRHMATINFDERSVGFIWFFSFLVWFSQVKELYGTNLILLLDEPGLSLHGKAQQDLVRYINKELRPSHQVVYTTHSPFMIDVENVFSLRSVEDVVEVKTVDGTSVERLLGTKVGEKILSRDPDTLFPLQGKLGFDAAQTFFVGPYVVVVEGPTEKALFDWFSSQLERKDREALDLRWAVCPAEGAPKITSFVTLFRGRGLRIAVLADYHEGQKNSMNKLKDSGLLEPGHLLLTRQFTGQDESDIEDLVGREMYIHLVNGAMKLQSTHCLPSEKPSDASPRVVKEVENHCGLLPPGYPEFGHYAPVEYLLAMPKEEVDQLPGLDAALDRFEAAFKALNALIPDQRC